MKPHSIIKTCCSLYIYIRKIISFKINSFAHNLSTHYVRIIIQNVKKENNYANIHWIIEKVEEFQKSNYFCFIDYAKAFDCVDHNKLENSERDRNTRPPDLPPEKSVCRSRGNSLNWTWNNRLVPNHWERSMSRLYIVTLLI